MPASMVKLRKGSVLGPDLCDRCCRRTRQWCGRSSPCRRRRTPRARSTGARAAAAARPRPATRIRCAARLSSRESGVPLQRMQHSQCWDHSFSCPCPRIAEHFDLPYNNHRPAPASDAPPGSRPGDPASPCSACNALSAGTTRSAVLVPGLPCCPCLSWDCRALP